MLKTNIQIKKEEDEETKIKNSGPEEPNRR